MQTLDLQSAEARKTPYQAMARVREAGRLCRVEPYGFIGVTRYDDVVQVLKNPQLFSSAGASQAFPPLAGAELFTTSRTLIGQDPPTHSRVRRLIQRAFTLHEMQAWEPRVADLTEQLLDEAIGDRREFDLIRDFAMPLPVTVISQMLGVDPKHAEQFKRWSDDMVAVRAVQVHPDAGFRQHREREIVKSCREFSAYFEGVIEERRRSPGDDLISAMVSAAEEGLILKPEELLGLTRLMLVAGNETTTNLLGNAMTAMLERPSVWRQLAANPELATAAVEETLRFDGPVLQLLRRTTAPVQLGGELVPEGTFVAPLLASANRDPRRFADPDTFDLDRDDAASHLAFGLGVHLCVGAPLARIETRLALAALARRFPDLSLADQEPQLLESLTLRGHKSLKLVRGSAAKAPSAERVKRSELMN